VTSALETGLATGGLVASVGVGLVFLQAGMMKLRHRELVPGVVANYRLLPDPVVTPVAAALPFVELALAVALMGGLRLAAPIAAGLLVLFALAMGINIRRGRTHIDCGCGRPQLRQPLSRLLVGRNLVLAALLLPRLLSTDAPDLPMLALAAAGGSVLFVLYLLFNGLAALSASPLSASRR
jgi:uncharacterized membrane protein YphA (DoxX/SURF4 family)